MSLCCGFWDSHSHIIDIIQVSQTIQTGLTKTKDPLTKSLNFGKNNKMVFEYCENNVIYFFQNEEIFVELDELDELDRIIHA